MIVKYLSKMFRLLFTYLWMLLIPGVLLVALLPATWFLIIPAIVGLPARLLLLLYAGIFLRRQKKEGEKVTVGFFHPYCNAGGGGERVLWTAVRAMQDRYDHVEIYIYTGDTEATPNAILRNAKAKFNIELPKPVRFVYLSRRGWLEADRYPVMTMIMQSLGSVYLGWEAVHKFCPDVFIDSMGYAFVLPIFASLGGCRVASYTHYPTVSSDMLGRVAEGAASYNNSALVARIGVLRHAKLFYYRGVAWLYGLAGSANSVVVVNSRWTAGHIREIWRREDVAVVYPPCDVSELLTIPYAPRTRLPHKNILSVAQFRPEKDHPLQLRAFADFLKDRRDAADYRLVLVGSCRGAEDEARVLSLRHLATQLGLHDQVDFKLGVPFDELKQCFSEAVVGLHTMWNEHFGIGVVELMAAGCITLAHKSGGPLLDIVVPTEEGATGYLADSQASFAETLSAIFALSAPERRAVVERARGHVRQFSEEAFCRGWLGAVEGLVR